MDRTHENRTSRILVPIDEFARVCLDFIISKQRYSDGVLNYLATLLTESGTPDFIKSDSGSEFAAHAVRD